MNILIYGAGVLGSLYAARLQQSGQQVTLLARGRRLADLRAQGIVLEHALTKQRTQVHVTLTEHLAPEDSYDLIVVLMRKNQVSAVLPILAANRRASQALFLHNNAAGPQDMITALGPDRVLVGFPGAGGTLQGAVVKYLLVRQQPTTLGTPDGRMTPALREVATILRAAGFPVALCGHMDAWLKTHAVFVTAIAGALYGAQCNSTLLARQPQGVPLLVDAVREGFAALRALGKPILPLNLHVLFERMPRAFPIWYWRRYLGSSQGEYLFAGHARAARDEMRHLAAEVQTLLRPGSLPTPALDHLFTLINLGA